MAEWPRRMTDDEFKRHIERWHRDLTWLMAGYAVVLVGFAGYMLGMAIGWW